MNSIDMRQQLLGQGITGVLAIILLGGTMALAVMRIPVPEFLVGFDGVIVTAVFANNAFFVQARTALPTAQALVQEQQLHHELAIAGTQIARLSPSTTTENTGANSP